LKPSISRSGKSSSTAYGKMQKGKKPAAAWVPAVTNLRQGRHTATKISLQRALATETGKFASQNKGFGLGQPAQTPGRKATAKRSNRSLAAAFSFARKENRPSSDRMCSQKLSWPSLEDKTKYFKDVI